LEEEYDDDSSGSHRQGARETWLCFGAVWVLCALDDIIGSVVAYHRRKTAQSRPGTGNRPVSRGGGVRPGSGAAALRPGSSAASASRARPGTVEGRAKSAAGGEQPERRRLLALKHFVAAVKADQDLPSCPVLETCLVEVATGVVPHVESRQLLAMQAYSERLRAWAEQEADGDADAIDVAIKQAMKGVTAVNSTPRARPADVAGGRSGFGGASTSMPTPATQASQTVKAATRGGGGWLPKTFVKEFNAEGEEVEPDDFGFDAEADIARQDQVSVKVHVSFSEHTAE